MSETPSASEYKYFSINKIELFFILFVLLTSFPISIFVTIVLTINKGQFDWAKNIPCRNIQIHGFCKWANKGCSFNHEQPSGGSSNGVESVSTTVSSNLENSAPSTATSATNLSSSSTTTQITSNISNTISSPVARNAITESDTSISSAPSTSLSTPVSDRKKFNLDTPSFTPSAPALTSRFSQMSPKLSDIPVFVPSHNNVSVNVSNVTNATGTNSTTSISTFNPETSTSFTPFSPSTPQVQTNESNYFSGKNGEHDSQNQENNGQHDPSGQSRQQSEHHYIEQDPSFNEPFFQQTNLYPINYHLYAPQASTPLSLSKKKNERTVNELFISDHLRQEIQSKNEECLKTVIPSQYNLPVHVEQYHSLYPIDLKYDKSANSFGYPTTIYKVQSNDDGKLYAMRRLENVPITSEKSFASIPKWGSINNANIVKVHEAFTTRAFGDNSLIIIYDYHPNSSTLVEHHFYHIKQREPVLITEDVLWNYLIQLTNALSDIHQQGLAVRKLDPSKIIMTGTNRIRLSSCALPDILEASTEIREKEKNGDSAGVNISTITDKLNSNMKISETEPPKTNIDKNKLVELQKADLKELGLLIYNLAKTSVMISDNTLEPSAIISKLKLSDFFKSVLRFLILEDEEGEEKTGGITVAKLQALIAPKVFSNLNQLQFATDDMESQLSREVENGRLVRLISKLDLISNRPENIKDGSWSETGERYPIKLFRDYVFHQVDDAGKPVIDLNHVITCLNKLDAGVEENLLLVSADEMSCLIISYKTLKNLVETCFNQLRHR
ncbi:hypothetical protein B5S33_g2653 [[Candida] boidinii]|nr:hypothetical protein B5S33_g2653 [[Candida] boidinii]